MPTDDAGHQSAMNTVPDHSTRPPMPSSWAEVLSSLYPAAVPEGGPADRSQILVERPQLPRCSAVGPSASALSSSHIQSLLSLKATDRIVVVDTETTGGRGRVVEIGAVEIVSQRITDNTFCRLINTGQKSTWYAAKVHGLSDRRLRRDGSLPEVVWPTLLGFLYANPASGHPGIASPVLPRVACHNAAFDVDVINMELLRLPCCSTPPRGPLVRDICTMKAFKVLFPHTRCNLDSACSLFGIQRHAAEKHTALGDAMATAKLLLRLMAVVQEMQGQGAAAGGAEAMTPAKEMNAIERVTSEKL